MILISVINMIAIVVLVVVTYKYMQHTRRMADIMVREFELKVFPLIDIKVSRSHSTRGFENTITLFNRGSCPIRIERILMNWWYGSEPATKHSKQEVIDEYLYTDNPISRTVTIRDDEIKNPKFPESAPLNGAHLGKIVAATIFVLFYDVNGRVQQTPPEKLDPLM